MTHSPSAESIIQQYLDLVAKCTANFAAEHRHTLLAELREHINEALRARTSGRSATAQDAYAVLATMDAPDSYAEPAAAAPESPRQNTRLLIIRMFCSLLQIAGLGAALARIPALEAVGGFAAIVGFAIVWATTPSSRWQLRLHGAAAVAGLFIILIAIARSC